ncbi:MAG TPA: acetoin dehydrogenase [Alcanivorax sp.]|jgi:butyryl-CoA dehydrogenase|uniref:Short-chain dehydrogenase/reductase family protein n=1 Tax=Alloalcanivorax venustensis ISO4 TaxID=1177184 RepID=A0ABS0AL18_9GAMM|nr:SDR family NAD(P)-dependent oxidoreductase [Alloalcanivorax venustensis]MAQ32439.1 acetoin dehydrogenase [Alcanivorax sp.]MBF48904.1 acetoin dehydrogenase [Alcanivorax sp.]MBF5054639.1 short-chain dehydrogenase/reductase family protein [Alloalcanivorax venustensis ISO4]MBT74397.1 acetoin dehydrogenase [Alcanivorax sp.]HAI34312.1 acetoin dehydrogenase [Alcanivorax sp.]|tara:strand:+ start:6414 stop:7247 length:834 start_codon:yes stop_codon:yes gene_type:complete
MKDFQNKVAVITGAGSGIGRALARDLAAAGARLALSDVNQVGLQETADSLGLGSDRLITEAFDVADRDAFYAFAERVTGHFGAAHLVFNNAGVALGATVEDMSYEDFEWLMGINFWGVVHGTKAFLPHLKAAGEGHIVNVSSVFGLIGVPTQSAYNAAKFAVRGFTEALRQELEMEGGRVSCTSVHPGGIKTNIARNARMGAGVEKITGDVDKARRDFEKMFRTTPEEASQTILKGVKGNKRRVLIGSDARAIDSMQRLMPTAYQRIMVAGQKMMRK